MEPASAQPPVTTVLGEPLHARPAEARVPALCEPGILLRVLLAVQVACAAGAAFDSAGWSAWGLRAAAAAAVSVPGTLAWLLACCVATPLLARLHALARLAAVGAAGGVAAGLACLPLRAIGLGLDPGGGIALPAVVGTGVLLGASLYHWLELRLRALLPLATEAGLIELQSRVQPHFLFNTLNTAIALVRVDPERAEEVLEDLADLFRAALGALDGDSTLGEEIRLARMYLAIEGMRFGRRLEVEWDVDEAVAGARVPALLLQPLVENAVRHGVEPNDAGGRVQVRARVRGGRAWVQIVNTVGNPGPAGHGIGLASARERLRLLHDFHAEFQAGLVDGGRYRVRLAVPL
jgi:two-component system sensor histidine kinase AlgZ